MSAVVIALVLAAVVVVAVARKELQGARLRSATVALDVDPRGVRREMADGRVEEVLWSEVLVVEVVRASVGPHKVSGGVVMLGAGPERGALVPLDAVSSSGLLERLAGLPRFDLKAFSEALEARPPSRTVVWERPTS